MKASPSKTIVVLSIGKEPLKAQRAIEILRDAADTIWRKLRNDEVYGPDALSLRYLTGIVATSYTEGLSVIRQITPENELCLIVLVGNGETYYDPCFSNVKRFSLISTDMSNGDPLSYCEQRLLETIQGYHQVILQTSVG